MSRFYIEVFEDGQRLPAGSAVGYGSLREAQVEAKRLIDDALPRNTVAVFELVGHAFLAGDGSTEYRED